MIPLSRRAWDRLGDRIAVGVSHTATEEGGSSPVRQVPQPHSHFHVTGLLVVAEGAGELGL